MGRKPMEGKFVIGAPWPAGFPMAPTARFDSPGLNRVRTWFNLIPVPSGAHPPLAAVGGPWPFSPPPYGKHIDPPILSQGHSSVKPRVPPVLAVIYPLTCQTSFSFLASLATSPTLFSVAIVGCPVASPRAKGQVREDHFFFANK